MRKKKTGNENLERWQVEDADRLSKLFKRTPLSQEKFGGDFGIGSQGAVSQYLNGLIPLNLTAAIRFAKGLGVSVADISPTLAKELEGLGDKGSHAIVDAIRVLPPPARKEVVGFIQFQMQGTPAIAEETRKHYVAILQELKEQIPLALVDTAANDARTAGKVPTLRSLKGRKA